MVSFLHFRPAHRSHTSAIGRSSRRTIYEKKSHASSALNLGQRPTRYQVARPHALNSCNFLVEQVEFVEQLLQRMCHYQHGHINSFLQPMLQRDFISYLPSKPCVICKKRCDFKLFPATEKGLDHIAENILSYLDDSSLRNAELVCKEWRRVIADGMLWKKLIERKVHSNNKLKV